MKNLSKVLALVLVVAMVFSFAVSASAKTSFKDDASIKYEEAVELLSALKVINGYTDGTFKPTGSITRGEFAVMVSYMVANDWSEIPLYSDIKQLGKDYAPYCTFADTKNHWSAGYVAYCAGNGYISGRNANVFDPDATITAAEISVILLRVMGYDATIENFGTTYNTPKGYNTQLTARNAGLLNGLDTMNFWAAATREQAAQLMLNALKGNVVTYGNVTFTLDLQGRVVVSNLNNTKATVTSRSLMSYCFNRVACVEATDQNGYAGHQWIAYKAAVNADAKLNVVAAKLTDVYADDSTLATYIGGTAYSKIAKDLGIAANTVRKATAVYVNGALVGGNVGTLVSMPAPAVALGLPTDLVSLYQSGTAGKALPDNCRLVVVKDSDRNQVGTNYKLLYYYELVATVTDIAKVNVATDPHYGQYRYTFQCWYEYPYSATGVGAQTRYVFSASDSAYSKGVYYLVEPNESDKLQPSANIDVVEDYQDFLSTPKAAKTVSPVKFTSGTFVDFAQNTTKKTSNIVNNAVSDGKSNYKVSRYAHDFCWFGADYDIALTLVYNTAGYVQGFAPANDPANVDDGYVYIDSLEFEVDTTARASLIRKVDAALSAQAKAQAYFPPEAGNSNYAVIDLKIDARDWFVEVVKANNGYVNSDGYVDAATDINNNVLGIALPFQKTRAYHDRRGLYTNPLSGSIRVYDWTYDGWYYYVKHDDGTYSLYPVGTDAVDTAKNNANVSNLVLGGTNLGNTSAHGYILTSSTDDNIYNMDLNTMTASISTITGYLNILPSNVVGTHGGLNPDKAIDGTTWIPYVGRVGGEIAVNGGAKTILEINEFNIANNVNVFKFALYKGTSGYYYDRDGAGVHRFKFLGRGIASYLFFADQVTFNGTVYTTQVVKDPTTGLNKYLTASEQIETQLLDDGTVGYELSLNAYGEISKINSYELTKETVTRVDVDHYVVLSDGLAHNFDKDEIWNYSNGKAETIAKDDTIRYADIDGDGVVDVIWLTHKYVRVDDPRWTTPRADFDWDKVLP